MTADNDAERAVRLLRAARSAVDTDLHAVHQRCEALAQQIAALDTYVRQQLALILDKVDKKGK